MIKILHKENIKKVIFLVFVSFFGLILFAYIFFTLTRQNPSSNEIVFNNIDDNQDVEVIEFGEPSYEVIEFVTGLDHPWDIGFLDNNDLVFVERGGRVTFKIEERIVSQNISDDLYVFGEGGLLGLAVDPDFSENRNLYFCFNTSNGLSFEVKVVRFVFSDDRLTDRKDIVTGLPTSLSGRHSGCQLEFGPDGALWIGTGDAAVSTIPQDPTNLGGKILRVDREGRGVEGNLSGEFDNRIYSYGHRNTQGISFFSTPLRDGTLGISTEHGPGVDDEINLLKPGNFGWDPVPGIYNESVAMTDKIKHPDSIDSIWSSGSPTIAISGSTFISGNLWKDWRNKLVVAALRGQGIRLFDVDSEGKISNEVSLLKDLGRVRTVQQGPNQNLYILTDNGNNEDKIFILRPKN